MPRYLGLHCLPRSQKGDARLIWVNFPRSQVLVSDCHSGISPVSDSDSVSPDSVQLFYSNIGYFRKV